MLIISSGAYLRAHADVAQHFLAATQRGYAFAAEHPADAAHDMVTADPAAFPDPQLVTDSQQLLVDGHYLTDSQGRVGYQQLSRWKAYGEFLYRNGLLADARGKPLTTEPDWSTYFSDSYLPVP